MQFLRYAVYYTPTGPWADKASAWLGWDLFSGRKVPQPDIGLPDSADITEAPRKYGLHATIKPPFRLAGDRSVDELSDAIAKLCDGLAPVLMDKLEINALGRFMALLPKGDTQALNALASQSVMQLDPFRAPLNEAELARRRQRPLNAAQEKNLSEWGYPFVLDQFRFHITLSGRLEQPKLTQTKEALEGYLGPDLPEPFRIETLTLAGEAEDGMFHAIKVFDLKG